MKQALVSIHDVMPETMVESRQLMRSCRSLGIERISLLVVPGRGWSRGDIQFLRACAQDGCELVAHGWYHEARHISTAYHRLHSLVLSRNVAEHLSCSTKELQAMFAKVVDWFGQQFGRVPIAYVPPAWALGKIGSSELNQFPFRCIETLKGLSFPRSRSTLAMPLMGFEADTWTRARLLHGLNFCNQWWWSASHKPLRIAIHPFDHRLRMQADLAETLRWRFDALSYQAVTERFEAA